MDTSLMFFDCPAYMDKTGAVRCGLPAAVEDRHTMRSTDGPLVSAKIRCPRGHCFNGPSSPCSGTGLSRRARSVSAIRTPPSIGPADPAWSLDQRSGRNLLTRTLLGQRGAWFTQAEVTQPGTCGLEGADRLEQCQRQREVTVRVPAGTHERLNVVTRVGDHSRMADSALFGTVFCPVQRVRRLVGAGQAGQPGQVGGQVAPGSLL